MEWAGPDLLTVCTAGAENYCKQKSQRINARKTCTQVKLHISNVPSIAEAQEIQREEGRVPLQSSRHAIRHSRARCISITPTRGMDMCA